MAGMLDLTDVLELIIDGAVVIHLPLSQVQFDKQMNEVATSVVTCTKSQCTSELIS